MANNDGIQTTIDGMNKIATAFQFLDEVEIMRRYQNAFFKTKSREALNKAKQSERIVDQMIIEIKSKIK